MSVFTMIVVVVSLAGIVGIWYLINRRGGAKTSSGGSEKPAKGDLTLRVVDVERAEIYLETVSADQFKAIMRDNNGVVGIPRKHRGVMVYYMRKTRIEDNAEAPAPTTEATAPAPPSKYRYAPIIATSEIKHSAAELYQRVKQPEQAVPHMYDMSADKANVSSYGQIIWWVAVMAFIMFLFVSGGGNG